jgi:hypothetical protein
MAVGASSCLGAVSRTRSTNSRQVRLLRDRARNPSGGLKAPKLLQLRPHGNHLLTSGAAFWLSAARVLVLAMAGAEALAWGYLGYLFGDGWVRWGVACTTGLMIFLVVWIIDVSLLTLDRASEEHGHKIFGELSDSQSLKARTFIAVGTRIFVVVASLTITAPYLSQLVFHKEISQWVDAKATRMIDEARDGLILKHGSRVEEKDADIQQKRDKLEAEVAGTGISGRHGKGPAAFEIERSIAALEQDREQLVVAQQAELSAFETDVAAWRENREAIATKYNLTLPQASILANREGLEALREKPEHRQTELAIKAFLAFIFIGLLILKLFEPRSIRYYLSEVLQQEYSRYLVGAFDELLPLVEKSTATNYDMPPQRLYDFLVNVWSPRRDLMAKEAEAELKEAAMMRRLAERKALEEAQRAAERERVTELKAMERDRVVELKAVGRERIAVLEEMRGKTERDIQQARVEVQQERKGHEVAAKSHQDLLSAVDIVKGHVNKFVDEAKMLKESDRFDAISKAELETRNRSQLAKAERKLRELENAQDTEKKKLKQAERALDEAEKTLKEHTDELRRIDDQIRKTRMQLVSNITTATPSPGVPSPPPG